MTLFVTSFNEKIYLASARQMISLWRRHSGPDDEMVCFCEGEWREYAADARGTERVRFESLEDDAWFGAWIAANRHNIPARYGGTRADHPSFWNTKASLWFRKAASWVRAYELAPADAVVVWLDTDVLITRALDPGFFDRSLGQHDVGYVCSLSRKKRTGVETGVFALRKNPRTDAFVADYKAMFDRSAAEWNLLERWDDGFVFKAVLEASSVPPGSFLSNRHALSGGASCVDWACKPSGDPLSVSCLKDHFVHQKGLHRGVNTDGLGEDKKHAPRTARYRTVRRRL